MGGQNVGNVTGTTSVTKTESSENVTGVMKSRSTSVSGSPQETTDKPKDMGTHIQETVTETRAQLQDATPKPKNVERGQDLLALLSGSSPSVPTTPESALAYFQPGGDKDSVNFAIFDPVRGKDLHNQSVLDKTTENVIFLKETRAILESVSTGRPPRDENGNIMKDKLGREIQAPTTEQEKIAFLKEHIFDKFIEPGTKLQVNVSDAQVANLRGEFTKTPPSLSGILSQIKSSGSEIINVVTNNSFKVLLANEKAGKPTSVEVAVERKLNSLFSAVENPSAKLKLEWVNKFLSGEKQLFGTGVSPELLPIGLEAMKAKLLVIVNKEQAEAGLPRALGNLTGKNLINDLEKYASGEKTIPGIDKTALKEAAAKMKADVLSKTIPDIPINDPAKLATYISDLDKSTSKWFGLKSSGNEDMKAIISDLKELQKIVKNNPDDKLSIYMAMSRIQESAAHFIAHDAEMVANGSKSKPSDKLEIVKALLPKTAPPPAPPELNTLLESYHSIFSGKVPENSPKSSINYVLHDPAEFRVFTSFLEEHHNEDNAKYLKGFQQVMDKIPPDMNEMQALYRELIEVPPPLQGAKSVDTGIKTVINVDDKTIVNPLKEIFDKRPLDVKDREKAIKLMTDAAREVVTMVSDPSSGGVFSNYKKMPERDQLVAEENFRIEQDKIIRESLQASGLMK
jgi:hypothetical protein